MEETTPQAVIASMTADLSVQAEAQGEHDAAGFISPAADSPTNGELGLAAASLRWRAAFEGSLPAHLRGLKARQRDLDAQLADHAAGEPIDIPPRPLPTSLLARVAVLVPFWLIVMLLAGTAETYALHGPIGTILNFDSGTWLNNVVAVSVVGFAALFAHGYGERSIIISVTRGAARQRARRGAVVFAGFECMFAVVAVVARLYDASYANGGGTVDPSAVWFFALFQLTFVVANLFLATLLARSRADRRRSDVRNWVATRAGERDGLADQIDGWAATEARLRSEYWMAVASLLVLYRRTLATLHPSPRFQVGWQMRNAVDLVDGRTYACVFPGFPAELFDTTGGSTPSDNESDQPEVPDGGGAGAAEDRATDTSPGPDVEVEQGAAGAAGPPVDRPDRYDDPGGAGPDDGRDLVDTILDDPAPQDRRAA